VLDASREDHCYDMHILILIDEARDLTREAVSSLSHAYSSVSHVKAPHADLRHHFLNFPSSVQNMPSDDEGSLPSCGNLWLIIKAALRKTFVRDGTQDISLEPGRPR